MKTKFSVPYKNTNLVGDILGLDPRLLVIHGAGKADRSRYDIVRDQLFDNGISSIAFDNIGHGETGGELIGSSLQDRTEQAIAIIKHFKLNNFSIIAGSMGGHTAIKLSENFDIKTLALFVPGVYGADVYNIPFGPGFSEAIRKPGSWESSDSWEILENFKGKLLVFYGELDEVVPSSLTQRIYESATKVSKKELIQIKGSSHAIQTYLNEHSDEMNRVIDKLIEYL